MGSRLRGVVRGVAVLAGAAVGGVAVLGGYRQATVGDMESHERHLRLETSRMFQSRLQLARSTVAVPWAAPSGHTYGLTYDRFERRADTLDSEAGKYTLEPHRPILLLAPPSFVSSRATFVGMFSRLKAATIAVSEVAGYGINSVGLAAEDLSPAALESSLEALVEAVAQADGGGPINIVAAGHAAFYALRLAERRPELVHKLALLNPTYRGPLPTAEFDKGTNLGGLKRALFALFGLPVLGFGVNHVFSSHSNIRHQLLSHVFTEDYVTGEVVDRNVAWSRSGHPLPKAAFLVGRTDAFASREALQAFLDNASHLDPARVRAVMGFGAPETNTGDLEPLRTSGFSLLTTIGALRSYVEYPKDLGSLLNNFFFLTPGREYWEYDGGDGAAGAGGGWLAWLGWR